MCLPGNSVLSSTKEDHQNKLLVTCYLLCGGPKGTSHGNPRKEYSHTGCSGPWMISVN